MQPQAALEQARRGDHQALGVLLEHFRPYVQLIVRAMRPRKLRARVGDSDLAQDALLEAHRSFPSFRGTTVAEFTAWLRGLVRQTTQHTLRGHLATEKRAADRERGEAELSGLAGAQSSPSAQVIRHEQAARVAAALAHLPADLQQVILARHVDGRPYAEIAQELGCSEEAARARYTRALRRLRQVLEES